MGTSIFGIGMSGMNAAQAGLVTTGHNIANASTPGYNRQEVVQTSNLPQFTGAGFLGQGVAVSTIRRIYSDTLTGQLAQAQAQGSQFDAFNAQIARLNNMLGDASAGLAPALQDFFSGVSDVAANPQSVPSRQALLSSAGALVARFQAMDQQMAQMRSGINTEITSSVGVINSFAQQIAKLNQSITVAESASSQQPANDLRDQRDALVAQLNQEVRASVVKDSGGNYNVFIGNGQPVVVGSKAFALLAMPALDDPQRVEVGYQSGASTMLLPTNSLQGGRLGGLLSFRAGTLDAAENALGRVAMGVAQTFNDQHALGQDLNGALGGNFFSVAGPSVLQSSGNTGAATVTAALQNVDSLTTSDYRLQYNGAAAGNENFTLTRISDGVSTALSFPSAGGYPYSFNTDGIALTLSAGAALNDSWTIEPTRLGAASIGVALKDPASIAAASPIRTAAALANTGSGAISAGSVSSVANLPLPAAVSLTFNAATGQFAVSGAVPAAGPFAYPTAAPGSATTATGAAPTFSGNIAANAFAINGVNVGAVAVGADAIAQGANVAAAINLVSAASGVTATASAATGAVTLTGAGGRQIAVTGTLTDTGLSAGVTPANTAVPALDGAAPTFSGNIAANAFAINGVNVGAIAVGANAVAQGANVAAAINLVSATSGVTATASATTGALTLTAAGGRQIAVTGTLTDTGLSAALVPGKTISFNGISFTLSGSPANGDVFTIERNSSGTGDNRNALALGALQLANTLGKDAAIAGSQPTTSFQGAYGQLVSQVGNTSRQMQVTAAAQQNVIAQTTQAQQSLSGVNLDEEAANLLRYQQAYQASGKMMQIASTLFQSVLDLGR